MRLNKLFEDPMTEVYLMFLQSILPTFTHMNMFLQREEPLIHALLPQLQSVIKNVFGKFVQPKVIAEALKEGGLLSVDFKDGNNHVGRDRLTIGFITRQKVNQLLEDGDISDGCYSCFFDAVQAFFIFASDYLLKWCPIKDDLLSHATWVDFEHRIEKSFYSVEFFIHRYKQIFTGMNMDKLEEQFLNYQLLTDEEIPKDVKEKAGRDESDYYRIDDLWGYLN